MAKSIETLVSFSAGEWSPTLTSRVDQQKYRAACLQLRNMLCLKTGPATRRPGTQYVARTKALPHPFDGAVRLQDFEFSINTTFLLEFGFHYLRFYSNGQQVALSSAPLWVSGTTYERNDYVEDPGDGNAIYRCLLDVPNDVTQPHLDGSNWVKQSILELWTPYDSILSGSGLAGTEVFQLQFAAINDVVYICHPSHPRYKLTRFGDTDWTLEPVVDSVPALLDQNATDTTIAASSATGTTSLTASAPTWAASTYYEVGASVLETGVIYNCVVAHISGTFATDLAAGDWEAVTIFQAGHVGSYWELSYLRDSAYIEYDGVAATGFAAGTSATITAFGTWNVRTYGVWSADIAVQASSDGGATWQTVRVITGRNDRNANIPGTAAKAQLYRLSVSNVAVPTAPGATNPRVVFECVDAFLFGTVRITAVADAYHATAEVVTQLTVANAWVSGLPYSVGDRVGYNGVNYICKTANSGAVVLANALTAGKSYIIKTIGTTDFTLCGAASNTVGLTFTATNAGNGNGDVWLPPDGDTTDWTADGYPTIYWSEGAWSAVRGYPRAITAFEQSVWCGGTAYQPQRVWKTVTNDIENWGLGDQSQATDGIAFDLDAVGDGGIVWMQSQDALFVGMVSSEWVVASSDSTQAIGPTSVTAHRQSRWGSNPNIAARVVGDALIFVQRQAFSARQMLFSIATNKYMSQDITALSDQIFNGGAVQLAYQAQGQKNGFLWATTTNGELVGMTYELDQEIFGWHRHFTGVDADDRFESVAVIPGKGVDDDEVWVVVGRNVKGSRVRYVERLNPKNWYNSTNAVAGAPGYPADKNSAYYVDAGVTYQDPVTNVFTGLDHLEGRTVAVAINAQDYGRFPVVGGQITVPDYAPSGIVTPATFAHIGLPFTSKVQPMNLDVDVHTGVTKGIIKKVTGITLSFFDTLACKFTDGSGRVGAVREIIFRDASNPFAETPLFTGDKQVRDFPGDYGLQIPVILYTDGPLPMTVLSVAVNYGLSGVP